jgi:hypothetical protein
MFPQNDRLSRIDKVTSVRPPLLTNRSLPQGINSNSAIVIDGLRFFAEYRAMYLKR